MDLRVSLVVLAALILCTSGVPVQTFSGTLKPEVDPTQDPDEDAKDIFSLIAEANNDSTIQLHQMDIVLPVGRSAMKCKRDLCRWNKTSSEVVRVPFTISKDYDARGVSVITSAMQVFATLTCVRFVPRTAEHNYVKIISDSGCWSYTGRIGGPQKVSLQANSCLQEAVVQHELNHVLGFYHEQSRSDRDNYVDIIYQNIIPSARGEFEKYKTENLGLEYDYLSLMHYGRFAYTKAARLPTIVPKPDTSVPIGQRYGLSSLDIAKINKLYDCEICSSLLPNASGTVTSGNYPSNYLDNASCVWLIRVPRYKVFLQFNAFDIQSSPDCASDYLNVYDGATRSSPVLLNRTCGTGQLPSLVASTNNMLLEFVSDNATTSTGFQASYSTVKCGSTFTSPFGVFSSPNYPSTYPPSMNCTWIMMAPAGYTVSLNITDFYVEPQRDCKYDYLLIANGPKTTSPTIGKYCGSVTIPRVVSTGTSLLVQFHSDGIQQVKGFQATYAFVPKKEDP